MSSTHLEFLEKIHACLRPKSYLEIGVNEGDSFALAQCCSIGIDPNFRPIIDLVAKKPTCFLYQMTSDEFFEKYNPLKILRKSIDLAFLDGMHLFEFLLRDLINTEKFCKKNSMILLHDCVPTDIYMTRRSQADPKIQKLAPTPEAWSGDVWKLIPIIKKYRPDLRMHVFDPSPTGMVCITNLDNGSTILSDKYFSIIDEFQNMEFENDGSLVDFRDGLGILKSSALDSISSFSNLTFF